MAPQRQLATPAYLVGLALICIPPFDALTQVLPLRFDVARWRFGAFGLLSNALLIPLTGLLIVFFVAAFFGHTRVQKVLGTLAILVGFAVAALLLVFALDVVQVRREVSPAGALAFKFASVTAAFKATIGILTLFAFGWAGWRRSGASRAATASRAGSLIIRGSGPQRNAIAPAEPPASDVPDGIEGPA